MVLNHTQVNVHFRYCQYCTFLAYVHIFNVRYANSYKYEFRLCIQSTTRLKYNFKIKYNYVFYLKIMIASQKKVHPPTQYLYGEII